MASASHPYLSGNENRQWYAGLKDDDNAYIQAIGFVPKQYPAQTVIVSQGDESNRIFIVESGWGCISHDLAGGQRQILDFALKGDIVMPLSYSGVAGETFVAQTELSVFEGSGKKFFLALANSPRIASLCLETLILQRALVAQHLTNVGRRSALARTAHLLLELKTRLDRTGAVTHKGFACPLTQYDLADALGLTPIHVNRMLRELRERGLLEFRQGYVRILDDAGVRRFAEFDNRYVDN